MVYRYDTFGRGDDTMADTGRDVGYSSARDYAAAGWRGDERGRGDRGNWEDRGYRERNDLGRGRGRDDDYRGSEHGYGAYGSYGDYGRHDRDRGGYTRDYPRGDGNRAYGAQGDRGFFDRAGDEVRSWFGDEDAEQRRNADQRYDAQQGRYERSRGGSTHDDHYQSWRRERIAELDRDYDEYRRENAQRFHNEFNTWRTDRQGQRDQLGQVTEHQEVVGSDGAHLGTVDKVRGDRIVLTKNDAEAGGRHHSIPSRWIQSVADGKVTLRKTADEAKAHWKDEERSGAFFGEGERNEPSDWASALGSNRSFSGTY